MKQNKLTQGEIDSYKPYVRSRNLKQPNLKSANDFNAGGYPDVPDTKAGAYVQALIDTGLYDPNNKNDFDYLMQKILDEAEAASGVWLIRVFKDWGTNHCRERSRIMVNENKTSPAVGILNGDRYEARTISLEFITGLIKYLTTIDESAMRELQGMSKLRSDSLESADVDAQD